MAENFRENPTALRHFIYYKFLEGEPIFKAFEQFCHVMGDEIIEYKEFEFWFMRFAKGNYDLSYDRSSDSKTRSLSDMPVNIFEKIVKELQLTDRLIVRKVCKTFQSLIDDLNPGFKSISIDADYHATKLHLDENCFEVGKQSDVSIHDLVAVLKNPKLQLDEFKVHFARSKNSENFVSMLTSSNRKIHTKMVSIRTYFATENDIKMIAFLDENVLERIVLKKEGFGKAEKLKPILEQISRFEQCKRKVITLEAHTNLLDGFPVESLLEFSRFTLDTKLAFPVKDVMRFINVLTHPSQLTVFNLKSEQRFGTATLKTRISRRFKATEDPNVRRIPIANSDEFFDIELNDHCIRIERTY